MKTIPLYIESDNGHDTLNIPADHAEVQKAVETQLNADKWVTLESKEGKTELLTQKDIPSEAATGGKELSEPTWKNAFNVDKGQKEPEKKQEAKKSEKEEWEDKFKDVKSATATNKSKGG